MTIYLIHGWGAKGEEGFRLWLKQELEKLGFEVVAFDLPNRDVPNPSEWLDFMHKNISLKNPEQVILLGHSLGGLAVLRFLEKLPANIKINKAILVAPVIKDVTSVTEEDWRDVFVPWSTGEFDYKKINNSAEKIIAFFSDNDRFIPLESANIVKDNLDAVVFIEHNKDHYSTPHKSVEVQSILNAIIK